MPAAGAVLTLLTAALALWMVVRLAARRGARAAAGAPAGSIRVLSGAALGVLLIAAGSATGVPLYAAAAGVGALCAAVGIAVRLELSGIASGPGYALPTLRQRAPGTAGTITAMAAAAAAGAAFLIAALAYRARLLGPSDPGLVALAAYLGVLLECALEKDGRGKVAAAAAAATAALLAAAIAATLVALLP